MKSIARKILKISKRSKINLNPRKKNKNQNRPSLTGGEQKSTKLKRKIKTFIVNKK